MSHAFRITFRVGSLRDAAALEELAAEIDVPLLDVEIAAADTAAGPNGSAQQEIRLDLVAPKKRLKKRIMRNRITGPMVQGVKAGHKNGYSLDALATNFGISKTSVERILAGSRDHLLPAN